MMKQPDNMSTPPSLQAVFDAAGMGIWDMNLQAGTLYMDLQSRAYFGLPDLGRVEYAMVIDAIHPDDRLAVDQAVSKALDARSGGGYTIRYRVAGPANSDVPERWIYAKGQAHFNADHKAIRFLGVVTDITAEITDSERHQYAEQHAATALAATGTGSFAINLDNNRMAYSRSLALLMTGDADAAVDRHTLIDHIHADDKPIRDAALATAAKTGLLEYQARFTWKDGSAHWLRVAGRYYRNPEGRQVFLSGTATDISDLMAVKLALQESEARMRIMFEQAPMAIALFHGPAYIIENANPEMLRLWGKTGAVVGLPLEQALPEIADQGFIALLDNVRQTGTTHKGDSVLTKTIRHGVTTDAYYDFSYVPVTHNDSHPGTIIVVAVDVTPRVLAGKAMEASERRFRSLVEEAPVPTALFVGRNLVIEVANKSMLEVWGKGTSPLNKPLVEAVPELSRQRFIAQLEDIFETGVPYHEKEGMAMLEVEGKLSPYYFNYTYQPLFNENGDVYAVLDMAINITEQVLARQKEQETQKMLQSAVEIANLGTWQYYPDTDTFMCSPRMCSWLNAHTTTLLTLQSLLQTTSRAERLEAAFRTAVEQGQHGKIDIEFPVDRLGNMHPLFLHIQGGAFRDANEQLLVIGTSEDITDQREWEYALEKQVDERTEDLAAANEELASANEELAVTNEELVEANENLFRSNTELEQYAYVASHDLQEPLRKIQVFSTMLQSQASLTEEGERLITKILSSSQRLTSLIQDLLQYSRLLRAETGFVPVDLGKVVNMVTDDFELILTEKQGTIVLGTLPVVMASAMQMNQLFYNLVSNGLKFISPDTRPLIQISAEPLPAAQLQQFISRPLRGVPYYRIKVQDNGIGIEQKFKEQIFEVFKRLHNQSAFPGSGIGLALCRKIVMNHAGHIYVESAPGKGAAFYVILPGPPAG